MSSISFVIGTKAQYIKTAPLLRLLQERGVPYRLIDTGQHATLAPSLRRELGVKSPDFQFSSDGNVKSVREALAWALSIFRLIAFEPDKLKNEIFQPGPGYCVIHGDTPSTFLALLMAKRAGKKVVHLEAGLRSFNLLKPFPEEIIRIICMRFSDILFAPSEWAMKNLRKLGTTGRCIQLSQNTNVEAMYHALGNADYSHAPDQPFALVTMHRVETIFSRTRLQFVLDAVRLAAADRTVLFILHDPTLKKLRDFGLLDQLEAIRGVITLPLVPHSQFLAIMERAEFIITDGGSIQEESFYLDVPCLVMRSETERTEGLGLNVRLGRFEKSTVLKFLAEFANLKQGSRVANLRPSEDIADLLLGTESSGSPCGTQNSSTERAAHD